MHRAGFPGATCSSVERYVLWPKLVPLVAYLGIAVFVPGQPGPFVQQLSSMLAKAKPQLSLDFITEVAAGLDKKSISQRLNGLQYMNPWIKNLGHLLDPNDELYDSTNKTRECIRILIDLTVAEQEVWARLCIRALILTSIHPLAEQRNPKQNMGRDRCHGQSSSEHYPRRTNACRGGWRHWLCQMCCCCRHHHPYFNCQRPWSYFRSNPQGENTLNVPCTVLTSSRRFWERHLPSHLLPWPRILIGLRSPVFFDWQWLRMYTH